MVYSCEFSNFVAELSAGATEKFRFSYAKLTKIVKITMVQQEPKVIPTARYELRDASRALGIHKSTLLNWTKQGLIRAGVRKVNGRKCWLGSELLRCWRATV